MNEDLKSYFASLPYPADITEYLEQVELSEWPKLLRLIEDREKRAQVVAEIDESKWRDLLAQLPAEEIADLISEMESDDAADIIAKLPLSSRYETLYRLPVAERHRVLDCWDILKILLAASCRSSWRVFRRMLKFQMPF